MTLGARERLEDMIDNPSERRPLDVENAKHALAEINRLEGLLQAHGIHPDSEYICRCGLRREKRKSGTPPF